MLRASASQTGTRLLCVLDGMFIVFNCNDTVLAALCTADVWYAVMLIGCAPAPADVMQARLVVAEAAAAEAHELKTRITALEAELAQAHASEEAQQQLDTALEELQQLRTKLEAAEAAAAQLRRDKISLQHKVARLEEACALS